MNLHTEIERQIGELQRAGKYDHALALLNRCSQIIKGLEERVIGATEIIRELVEHLEMVAKSDEHYAADLTRAKAFLDSSVGDKESR